MVYIIPISIFIVLTYLISMKKNKTQDILTQSLIILTTYLFISTTIHPWYIIPLIFLSCFTNYRYPIFWSLTIFLSYFSYFLHKKYYTAFSCTRYLSLLKIRGSMAV